MRKGYRETMPKNTHDAEGRPIFGAPQTEISKREQQRQTKEEERQAKFRRDADKPIPWAHNLRTANGGGRHGYGYINFEAIYKGFRKRLVEDPAFENEVLELIMDRIMAELYVPLNHRPQAGLRLPIARKPGAKTDAEH